MVSADDVIVNIKAMVLADIDPATRLFELEHMTELGDIVAAKLEGVNLKTVSVTTHSDATSPDMFITNYPNPLVNKTTFTYSLPEAGKVELVVYDNLGKTIRTLVDNDQIAGVYNLEIADFELAPGVYTYRLILQGAKRNYTANRNMVVGR
jgi:hypothetical protein